MSTATGAARARARAGDAGEHRVAFRTGWEGYQALARLVDGQPERVRIAFDGEVVELMSPGAPHERDKHRLERIVAVLTEERSVPCQAMASTRWEHPEAARALEADATFYLTRAKILGSRHRSKDIADYPMPDLAIEVDHGASRVDRESIYRALAVPEVWSFDGVELRIEVLDGGFQLPTTRLLNSKPS